MKHKLPTAPSSGHHHPLHRPGEWGGNLEPAEGAASERKSNSAASSTTRAHHSRWSVWQAMAAATMEAKSFAGSNSSGPGWSAGRCVSIGVSFTLSLFYHSLSLFLLLYFSPFGSRTQPLPPPDTHSNTHTHTHVDETDGKTMACCYYHVRYRFRINFLLLAFVTFSAIPSVGRHIDKCNPLNVLPPFLPSPALYSVLPSFPMVGISPAPVRT